MADISNFYPAKGLLTFQNEGQEGGPYHSRKFCVPSATSGLTIGRGYDMKEKTKDEIKNNLTEAGVAEADAEIISNAAGLKGDEAKKFIADNALGAFEISPEAQLNLFNMAYEKLETDTIRICTKEDVELKYGKCNWDYVDVAIRELLVDFRYRGDYTPGMRGKIQTAAITNDFTTIETVLSTRENFSGIDDNRFNARIDFLKQAVAAKSA